MLANSALSGKLADPMTIAPPAAAEPEPDAAAEPEAAADALVLLASGSDEPPQAVNVRAAASPAATSVLPLMSLDRTDTAAPRDPGRPGVAGRGSADGAMCWVVRCNS